MEKISDKIINSWIGKIEPTQGTSDRIEIYTDQMLQILQELKEHREYDNKYLGIKGQLRLVRDKCPRIWEMDITYCPEVYGLKQFSYEQCMNGHAGCCKECWDKALEGDDK